MKKILFFAGWLLSLPVFSQQTAVHCLGNGNILVYEQQSDIVQLLGPPYSSPTIFTMHLPDSFSVVSEREKGTAVWRHKISKSGKPVAEMIDFVVSEQACFIRKIKSSETFRYQITLHSDSKIWDNKKSLLMKTPSGTPFYNDYPLVFEQWHQFIATGCVALTSDELQITPGEGVFYVVGGDFPECMTTSAQIIGSDVDKWLTQTREWWSDFTSKRKDFNSLFSKDVPQREKLLQTIDDVAVMIKCQQGKEGSVIAGYNYHLGYVRDQYGVSRGLLTLGYTDEARRILDFYYRIWQKEGRIQNAQGVGNFAFHVHENDHVEITGYLIAQAFDYLNVTSDSSFIVQIFPMLNWAWQVQVDELINGMLPFNGDETFVAGGILPRSALLDGSAEATLLFINGGESLLKNAEALHLWTKQEITQANQVLAQTKLKYAANFLTDGKLKTNNPDRMKGHEYPPFRHGVCEQERNIPGCEFFGWTQKTSTNRYLCANCFTQSSLPEAKPETFFLPSIALMPCYINDSFLDRTIIRHQLDELADYYSKTGKFPSKQESTGVYKILGYDFGFFLYALTRMNHPLKQKVYDQMMDALDATGSWVEYYQDGNPNGTFCRPWESAINLEAAILFAESFKKY
jgi:hypothetical protein